MEVALLVAFIAVGITAVSSVVDFLQTYHIRKVQSKLNEVSDIWQDAGSVGDQFGEWLLRKDKPDTPTNLENCASLVGRQIAGSFQMSMKGIMSGESRLARSVEQKVLEGLQAPETNALLAFCDRIGVDRTLAGTVLQILESRGMLGNIMGKNNGAPSKGDNFKL